MFSEKLHRPLSNSAIPVVIGTKDVHKIAPPHSYIDVRDFKSPKDLAEYLLYLDKNHTAYMSYFHWRKDYEVKLQGKGSTNVFCHLCHYIHTQNRTRMKSFNEWFFQKSECKNPYKEIKFS